MDIIKTLKDIVVFAQKSNDIETTQKLISIQQEVINMQEKIYNLSNENKELKEIVKKREDVERYRGIPIITLKNDNPKILYCSNCYGKDDVLIPVHVIGKNRIYCRSCQDQANIDYSPDSQKIKEMLN